MAPAQLAGLKWPPIEGQPGPTHEQTLAFPLYSLRQDVRLGPAVAPNRTRRGAGLAVLGEMRFAPRARIQPQSTHAGADAEFTPPDLASAHRGHGIDIPGPHPDSAVCLLIMLFARRVFSSFFFRLVCLLACLFVCSFPCRTASWRVGQ